MNIRSRSVATLLIKDLRLQWAAFLVLVVFEVLTWITFESQFPPPMRLSAGVFLQGVASIGTFVMAYRAIAAEEAGKTIRFLRSLPLTCDEIYGSKFIFMAACVALNALVLNLAFVLGRLLLPWEMLAPTTQSIVVGLVVQFVFAGLLVSVAVLTSSEKAIWVPFPVVILLLNAYTLLTGDRKPLAGSAALDAVRANWLLYCAAVIVLLVPLVLLTLRRVARKTSVAG